MTEENKRAGAHNKGYEFESHVGALLAVKLALDDSVRDFSIRNNVEQKGKFDDIIVEIHYHNSVKSTYNIQCKYKESRVLTYKNFESGSGSFSLTEYQTSVNKFENKNVNYVIYTNAKTKEKIEGDFLTTNHFDGNIDLLDTSGDAKNVFQFSKKAISETYHDNFLSKLIVLVGQRSGAYMEEYILAYLKVQGFELSGTGIKLLRDFFKEWIERKHVIDLKKIDIQGKLLEYTIPVLNIFEVSDTVIKHWSILNESLLNFNLTLISDVSVESISNTVWRCLSNLPGIELGNDQMEAILPNEVVSEIFNQQSDEMKKITNELKKNYYPHTQLTQKCLYLAAWKCKLVPLVLQSKSINVPLRKLDRLLKKLSFVLVNCPDSTNSNLCALEDFEHFDISKLKKDLFDRSIAYFSLSFQRKLPLPINHFIKKYKVLEQMTPDVYIKLFHGTLMIGSKIQEEEIYIKRNLLLAEFDPELYIDAADSKEILVFTNLSEPLANMTKFDASNTHFCQYTTEPFEIIQRMVDGLHYFTKKSIHVFEQRNANLYWVYSVGDSYHWEQYTDILPVRESELQDVSSSRVNIIVGSAGMGKTSLLRNIGRRFDSATFVSIINVGSNLSIFPEKDIWDIILDLEGIPSYLREFMRQILIHSNEEKQFALILDDIDILCHGDILKLKVMVKSINRLWMSSGYDKCGFIEKTFCNRSLAIEPLTIIHSKKIFRYVLEKAERYETFDCYKQFSQFAGFLDPHIAGSPQLMIMFANLFISAKIENDFSIGQLYKLFIETEIGRIYGKLAINSVVEIYSQFALKHYFTEEFLVKNKLINLKDFRTDSHRKNMIVSSINDDGSSCFGQKSYTEYLAAQLIADKLIRRDGNWLDVYGKLFCRGLLPVRRFFDYVISDKHPLHRAVLNNSIREIMSIIQKKQKMEKDIFGRTALHLSASYGSFYNISKGEVEGVKPSNEIKRGVRLLQTDDQTSEKKEQDAYEIFRLLVRFEFNNSRDRILKYNVYDYAFRSFSLKNLDFIYSRRNKKKLPIWDGVDPSLLIYHIIKHNFHNILSTRRKFGIDQIDKGEWKLKSYFQDRSHLFEEKYDGVNLTQLACYEGSDQVLQILLICTTMEVDSNLKKLTFRGSTMTLLDQLEHACKKDEHDEKCCCWC